MNTMLRNIASPVNSRFALMNLSLHWRRNFCWYSFSSDHSYVAAYFCADLCCTTDSKGENVFFSHLELGAVNLGCLVQSGEIIVYLKWET
jgi:hypothetical protein